MKRKIGWLLALVCLFAVRAVWAADECSECGAPAENSQLQPHASVETIAFGAGMDAGGFGLKYTHSPVGSPFELGIGVGVMGLSPQVQLNSFEDDGCGLYVSTGLLISPWQSLAAVKGTMLGVAGVGLQNRARYGKGVYWNAGVEEFFILRGSVEGHDRRGFGIRLQIGTSF